MDLSELARELRQALQQQAAINHRIDALVRTLEKEALDAGSSGAVCPYDEIVREWNGRCASKGMKRRNTAGELKVSMLRVWRKHPSLDAWRAAFDACGRNSWWRGEGGWQGNLESFLRPANFGKFFDEALGAAVPEASPALAVGAGGRSASDTIDDEIQTILDDKSRPLPSGFTGLDPREVRGKDEEEFVRRYDVLKDWMSGDWRFGS